MYRQRMGSNWHCKLLLNNGNCRMGLVTNNSNSNILGYRTTPSHSLISSAMRFASFLEWLCCFFLKWLVTSDGYTAQRHFLHTITCYSNKWLNMSVASAIIAVNGYGLPYLVSRADCRCRYGTRQTGTELSTANQTGRLMTRT